MLKITPDFAYNAENKSIANGVSIQSRISNKISFLFDGQIIDTNFVSTDTVSHGYGMVRNEYSTKISYDILPETPLNYSQHSYVAQYGKETKYTVDGGIHFTRFPHLDINMSRTILDSVNSDTSNIFDSIFHIKDRIGIRLYESSSDLVQKFLHVNKFCYELMHAEYQYRSFTDSHFYNGRRTNGWFSLMPVQQLTVLGDLAYNKGNSIKGPSSTISPLIEIQAVDAPPGVDITGKYDINLSKYYSLQYCTDTLKRSVDIKIRPGQWLSPLRWFSLRGGIDQNVNSYILTNDLSISAIVFGKEGRVDYSDNKTIGISIFPNEAITFRNDNSWLETDSMKQFKTANDFQWQINSKNIFQSTITYSLADYYSLNCKVNHDYAWTTWLRILPEVNGSYSTDSIGRTISGGSKITTFVSLLPNSKILKSLLNIQSFSYNWAFVDKELDYTDPDMCYSFTLRFVIHPKIQFVNNEQIGWKNEKFDSFSGKLTATIFF
jgi:hypothetical protein